MSELPLIAIPMGDPAGIGPEIVAKALAEKEIYTWVRPVVIGDKTVLEKAIALTKSPLKLNIITNPSEGIYQVGTLNLINLDNLDNDTLVYGKVQAQAGQAAYEYVTSAIELALAKKVKAVTTTAINKESLKAANVPYIGHTEMFAAMTKVENPLTMFQVGDLRVFFYSRHVSLKQACELINQKELVTFVKRCTEALTVLGVDKPRIAMAGLNPHSGENGLFGNEEVESITPAVKEIQATTDINLVGPIGADSVFHQGRIGEYDVVLSLYHDQGHIATKMIDFERTISITNNMPFLRTSVDHGTAFDIAGTGEASAVSLIEALRLAGVYADNFHQK